MNRRERQRHEFALLATTGVYHTLDQWTRVLVPFTQWNLQPRVPMEGLMWLTTISTMFTLIGTLFVAQMIDVFGLRKSALISSIVITIYQLFISHFTNYYGYVIFQSLLMFNNMQMIIDAAILNLEGEDGCDKKRTRLITKILIPTSIGLAAGPYCALQMIFFVTPSLEISQAVCAAIAVVTLLPLIWFFFPDTANTNKSLRPDINSYLDIMKNERAKWCTILLMMVTGPYIAYDNIVRLSLAHTTIHDPQSMHNLFLILGLTTTVVNVIFLPKLQEHFAPQHLLTASFGLLCCSYTYLALFREYTHLLIGMPVQVVGATICMGELSSQLMGTIGKNGAGKAAAVLRMSQLAAGMIVPFITGTYFSTSDSSLWLCILSAALSAFSILLVRKYGTFMQFNSSCLPSAFGKFD